MVQILPPKTSLGAQLGQALGGGLSQGLETGINQGRLQSAFDQLLNNPNGNFTEQLSKIAPVLLTTPGGNQALGEISSLLASRAQAEALTKSIENQRKIANEGFQAGQQGQPGRGEIRGGAPVPVAEQKQGGYRQTKAPSSASTPFPQITAGPQPLKEYSPRELENFTLDIMKEGAQLGRPIPYEQARQIANQKNNDVRATNNQILQEKELRDKAQKVLNSNIINRAKNSGLIKDPEDETVAEKFATEARNASNETEAWEYVRTNMRRFDSAKSQINRELGLANPVSTAYRKLNGNYKDFEEISKSLQRPLDFFREHGLYDEGLNYLVNELGFGNEQAHLTMFPFSAEEKKGLESFTKNPVDKKLSQLGTPDFQRARLEQFPGRNNALPEEKFQNFKDELATYLSQNKEADLVSLRGNLNQDKRYDWNDIYRAMDELIQEGRFSPDPEQDKQLNTIKQAPTPGLGAYFQYLWTGKK